MALITREDGALAVDPISLQPTDVPSAGLAAAGPVAVPATPLETALRAARIAIAAVLLAALGLNALLTWRSAAVTERLQRREMELVHQARVLDVEVPSLLGAGRGYLVSQDGRFLADLAATETTARAALDRLEDLVHSDSGRQLVASIATQLGAVIDGVERRIELAQAGRLDEARREFIAADEERRRLLADLGELVGREERLLTTTLDDLQRERVLGFVLFAALLVAVGALAVRYLTISGRVVASSETGFRDASAARDEALAALRTTMREREVLIVSVSHDLKNPLTAIQGQAQLMQRRVRSAGSRDARGMHEGLASIEASAKKLARLINELTDTVRLQMGQALDLQRQPADLVALTRQAVAEYRQSTDRHAVRFESTDETLVGTVDAPRIERVLANLLSNAIKYSPAGGEIAVAVAKDGGDAVIEVCDRGLGIPAAELDRVFDRYFRAGNVAGRVEGSGLGLAGVRQIVEGHGGTVAATSRIGGGSCFTVRLPLDARAAKT